MERHDLAEDSTRHTNLETAITPSPNHGTLRLPNDDDDDDWLSICSFPEFDLTNSSHVFAGGNDMGARLSGEIHNMSASTPGAERYFRRSLHVKNCRDRLYFDRMSEKGGVFLLKHVR